MAAKIKDFYKQKNFLITGGTGLLGMSFTEKILRVFPDVGNIYMIVRGRKGQTITERKNEYIQNPVFNRVKQEQNPDFSKLVWLEGDLRKRDLGLSRTTINDLQESVNVVIHSGATIKFNEPLKCAIETNVQATNDVLDIASGCTDLSCFMHISTAYCKALLSLGHVDEEVMSHPIAPKDLIQLASRCTEKELNSRTKNMLLEWPNTYTYTKNAAENVCLERKGDFPIGIFRPGIVMPAYAEPVPFWIGSIMAWLQLLAECNRGLTLDLPSHTNANAVPVDLVTNGMLMALYRTAVDRKFNIFNYTTNNNPFEYIKTYQHFIKNIKNYKELIEKRKHFQNILLPTERELEMVTAIEKFDKFHAIAQYFMHNPFTYSNNNMDNLWDAMTPDERELLPFDVRSIDWVPYYEAMNENIVGTEMISFDGF